MKQYLALSGILILSVLLFSYSASAQIYEVDLNTTSTTHSLNSPSTFSVQVLKYDPYPVNAGDWFDLWLEVQNVGQNDAKNIKFSIQQDYPFSTENSTISYGIIYGSANAYKIDSLGSASYAILKFRVKVADNAPEGTAQLKFAYTINSDNPQSTVVTALLPIDVAKTKTDFDAIMQDSSGQGLSFAIANIGENPATAVTVAIEPQQGLVMSGSSSTILGNLAKGDFTTVTFLATPTRNVKNVTLSVSYTDIAGIRNTVEKIIPLNSIVPTNSTFSSQFGSARRTTVTTSTSKLSPYLYVIIGIILGLLGIFVYNKIKKRK